jgi:two-component sensor histidine kinase
MPSGHEREGPVLAVSEIIPANEGERLAALRRYDILDTPPDGAFDRVTRIAARMFDVPIAIISLVDQDRIWFKSHHGVDVEQIARDPGLCASAILGEGPWILSDASGDPRALANPLVAGEFGLRFYLAVPLRTHDGHGLGTLCVIDQQPREVTKDEIAQLTDLAAMVMDQMELRLAARRAMERVQTIQREIDHRLLTSLQSLSLMLAMQSDAARDPDARKQLRIAANRTTAVADFHSAFFSVESTERVGGLTYLRRLSVGLADMFGAEIEADGTEVILAPGQIQSIGLIVHELVSNAVAHGGPKVRLSIEPDGQGQHVLTVTDNGPGLPEDFTPETSTAGIGMTVILAMVEQLEGRLTAADNAPGRGARFVIGFPATIGAR